MFLQKVSKIIIIIIIIKRYEFLNKYTIHAEKQKWPNE